MFLLSVMFSLSKRGVSEPHQRVQRYLIDIELEEFSHIHENSFFIEFHRIEYQIDIDEFEESPRFFQCHQVVLNRMWPFQVSQYIFVEWLYSETHVIYSHGSECREIPLRWGIWKILHRSFVLNIDHVHDPFDGFQHECRCSATEVERFKFFSHDVQVEG